MADIVDVLRKIAKQRRKEGKPLASPKAVKNHMKDLKALAIDESQNNKS